MASSLRWLADQKVQQPRTVIMVDASRKQPARKDQPGTAAGGSPSGSGTAEVAPHMAGLRTDGELEQFMSAQRGNKTVVEFGSSWCTKCHEIFPTFYALSKKYTEFEYAVAQVDYMKEGAKDLKYSPTFLFHDRNGRRVDAVLGREPQRLEDHLWLHTDG